MLALRPTCENCNKALPPDSTEAMICSYECTFCKSCVDGILGNVCPNCGGGFCPRPIRPQSEYRKGISLQNQPATDQVKHKPVDPEAHQRYAATIQSISPEKR
ncbi:MAG: DUF1272 domain-containing protein [Chloroflexota bacterium]